MERDILWTVALPKMQLFLIYKKDDL